MFILAGCGREPPTVESQLAEASELRVAGSLAEAGDLLDRLISDNPGNASLVAERARVFDQMGDNEMAGFYFLEAARLDPENSSLLLEARSTLRIAGDSGGELAVARLMAENLPGEMDARDWFLVGGADSMDNRTRPAIEAYQRGIRLNDGVAPPEVALDLGLLFNQIGNPAQAEIWLDRAVEDEETELSAKFGLLDLFLSTSAWERAEGVIADIDESYPGAVEASEFREARDELSRWREARAGVVRMLQESTELPPVAVEEDEEPEPEEATVAAESEPATDASPEVVETDEPAALMAERQNREINGEVDEGASSPRPSVKLTAEDQTGEPDATVAAVEPDETEPSGGAPVDIEPAEEDWNLTVTFDGAQPGMITFEEDVGTSPANGLEDIDWNRRATVAFERGDPSDAIRLHWRALSRNPEKARLWHQLSLAYLSIGENSNAETAALEAMRHAPRDIDYAIQYLRIIQPLRRPGEWVREAEQVAARFPNHPDMVFNLARGYERIANDRDLALSHYERFLDLSPNHPMAGSARDAVQRLR